MVGFSVLDYFPVDINILISTGFGAILSDVLNTQKSNNNFQNVLDGKFLRSFKDCPNI